MIFILCVASVSLQIKNEFTGYNRNLKVTGLPEEYLFVEMQKQMAVADFIKAGREDDAAEYAMTNAVFLYDGIGDELKSTIPHSIRERIEKFKNKEN